MVFGQALAQSIGRIEGEWSNQSGYNIGIKPDQLGGWTLWGSAGEGSIQRDGTGGGNIRVEAEGMRCWFKASVLRGDQDMRWRPIRAEGAKCERMNGIFDRTAN